MYTELPSTLAGAGRVCSPRGQIPGYTALRLPTPGDPTGKNRERFFLRIYWEVSMRHIVLDRPTVKSESDSLLYKRKTLEPPGLKQLLQKWVG